MTLHFNPVPVEAQYLRSNRNPQNQKRSIYCRCNRVLFLYYVTSYPLYLLSTSA